jgi:hypothetical protein
MATWRDLEEQAPGIADKGRTLLFGARRGEGLLATAPLTLRAALTGDRAGCMDILRARIATSV